MPTDTYLARERARRCPEGCGRGFERGIPTVLYVAGRERKIGHYISGVGWVLCLSPETDAELYEELAQKSADQQKQIDLLTGCVTDACSAIGHLTPVIRLAKEVEALRADKERLDDVIRRATAPQTGVTFYRKLTTGNWQYQERDEQGYMGVCGSGDSPRAAIDAARKER